MSDKEKVFSFNIEEYLQRLVKLIPTEIILLYSAALAFMPTSLIAQFIIIGICTALTPLYLIFATKVKNYIQVTFSSIAFIVYALATGGALVTASWYQSWIPGLVLMVFSFIVPIFIKTPEVVATAAKSGKNKKSWRQI